MPLTIEVLRSFQWIEVELGQEPYVIKSNVSNPRTRYVISQDEDGAGGIIVTMSPVKDDLAKRLSGAIGEPLFDFKIEPLDREHAVFIEGVLPGNTKSEMLRIRQE